MNINPPLYHFTPSDVGLHPVNGIKLHHQSAALEAAKESIPCSNLHTDDRIHLHNTVEHSDCLINHIKHAHLAHHHFEIYSKLTQASILPSSQNHPNCHHPHSRDATNPCALIRRSFWNLRCGCLFSTLPDEVLLLNVLTLFDPKELVTLQQVCTRWKFLASDKILWQSLDLSSAPTIDAASLSSLLAQHGSSLKVLKLCGCTKITASLAPPASSLNSSSAAQQQSQSVSISSSPENHSASSSTSNLPSLVNLFVSQKPSDMSEDIPIFSSSSQPPLSLGISTDRLTHLREVHFCKLRTLTDDVLIQFTRSSLQLRHLSLFDCVQLTDSSIELILSRSPYLEELSLRGVARVTAKSLSSAPSSLRALNLAGCRVISTEAFISLGERCPNLERLNAHGCLIEDDGVLAISRGCKNLNTLHLSSSNPFAGNRSFTDRGMEALSQLPGLTCLNLQGSSQITDAGILYLVMGCRQLQRLNLGGCQKITNDGIFSVAEFGSELTHLSLFQCQRVTDEAILQIARTLHNLLHLDLHSCFALTSYTINNLASHQSSEENGEKTNSLRSVDLPNAVHAELAKFSVSGFPLPRLQTLDVGSCKHILSDHVAELSRLRPTVNVIHY